MNVWPQIKKERLFRALFQFVQLFCQWKLRNVFLDWLAIDPGEGIPAYKEEFLEHLQAVFEIADAGALVMTPRDGDLAHNKAALERYEENFRIETPALYAL